MTEPTLSPGAPRFWSNVLTASCALLLCGTEAQAVLGGTADTVHADQMRFKGERYQSKSLFMNAHEIILPDGSRIREYVNAAGVVFAVSWRTRLKPDLELLLGKHYAVYAATTRAATGVAHIERQQSVRLTNLVVRQAGRMNSYGGLAYVPTLVPEGFDADVLR